MSVIGTVRGGRLDVADDRRDAVEAVVELDPDVVEADATLGLDGFSHLEVVYVFDRVDEGAVCRGLRRPRGRPDWPQVGILAQRAKDRPNRIGVATCLLLGVDGLRLSVRGLDAVDGTPVLDVKPYMTGFAPRQAVRAPDWATELMDHYWQ
ncbi:MAG: SAM-dependent methyltransferase [Acidobacteriota bacterium]|nr:SAM-dependent methyltransferase [Acidobacteriota bacterium]